MIHSCLQYYVIHLSSGSSYISKATNLRQAGK